MTPLQSYKSLPFLTVALAFCSLVISCTSLSHILQYDRAAIEGGQLWLIVTGHLSHWSLDNLVWDLLVFMVLGVMAERRSRRGFVFCLTFSVLVISSILWFWQQDMDCYRGLSGLDSALFGFVAFLMIRERIQSREYRSAGFILVAGVAFLMKIVYETFMLQAVFSSSAGLFVPVPLAHLSGGLIGIGVALFFLETKPTASSHSGPSVVAVL